ncbi:MAG: hypothetical protein NTY01_03625 [Verrucomicrobia bacterium]|nr:hypothetical protein [Verrucomicrobiota bacterium]
MATIAGRLPFCPLFHHRIPANPCAEELICLATRSGYTPPTMFTEIKESLQQLYLEDARPWLVGFNGGLALDTSFPIPCTTR